MVFKCNLCIQHCSKWPQVVLQLIRLHSLYTLNSSHVVQDSVNCCRPSARLRRRADGFLESLRNAKFYLFYGIFSYPTVAVVFYVSVTTHRQQLKLSERAATSASSSSASSSIFVFIYSFISFTLPAEVTPPVTKLARCPGNRE